MGFHFSNESNSIANRFRKLYFHYAPIEISPLWKHFPFLYHSDFNLYLEVHCSIIAEKSPFSIDVEALWQRARVEKTRDDEIMVLSPSDLLIHLCLHICYDDLFHRGLQYLYDIIEVIRYYGDEMDWGLIKKHSAVSKADRCVYVTLILLKEIFEEPLPDDLLNQLKPDYFKNEILHQFKERLFKLNSEPYENKAQLFIHEFREMKSAKDKREAILNIIFPWREFVRKENLTLSTIGRIFFCFILRTALLFFQNKNNITKVFNNFLKKTNSKTFEADTWDLKKWLGHGLS
jgi:hypothetical protein